MNNKESDEEDAGSDVSIVTNSTPNVLDERFVSSKKLEDSRVMTETYSPLIPVISSSFLTESLRRSNQNSKDDDSDSSVCSQSLFSAQKTTQKRSTPSLYEKYNSPDLNKFNLFSLTRQSVAETLVRDMCVTDRQTHTCNSNVDKIIYQKEECRTACLDHADRTEVIEGKIHGQKTKLLSHELKSPEHKKMKLTFDELESHTLLPHAFITSQLETNLEEASQETYLSEERYKGMENYVELPYEVVALTNCMLNNEKLESLNEKVLNKSSNEYLREMTPRGDNQSSNGTSHRSCTVGFQGEHNIGTSLENNTDCYNDNMVLININTPRSPVSGQGGITQPEKIETNYKDVPFEITSALQNTGALPLPRISFSNKYDTTKTMMHECFPSNTDEDQNRSCDTSCDQSDTCIEKAATNAEKRKLLNKEGLLLSSQETLPPEDLCKHVKRKGNCKTIGLDTSECVKTKHFSGTDYALEAQENCQFKTVQVSMQSQQEGGLDGSQLLFTDTQSTSSSVEDTFIQQSIGFNKTKEMGYASLSVDIVKDADIENKRYDTSFKNTTPYPSILSAPRMKNPTEVLDNTIDTKCTCSSKFTSTGKALINQQKQPHSTESTSFKETCLSSKEGKYNPGFSVEDNHVQPQQSNLFHGINLPGKNLLFKQQSNTPNCDSVCSVQQSSLNTENGTDETGSKQRGKSSASLGGRDSERINSFISGEDMDIVSDVEPSQMILMETEPTIPIATDKRSKSSYHPSSQTESISSFSSLGDISDNDINYKTKEKDILVKVETMQAKTKKKLESKSKKNLAMDIESTKQQLQTIKSILIKIAERHKVERNRLSMQVKKCSKDKMEKNIIRQSLVELGERQKSLFRLFQKHKEISNLIRNDVKLKEYLALATVKETKGIIEQGQSDGNVGGPKKETKGINEQSQTDGNLRGPKKETKHALKTKTSRKSSYDITCKSVGSEKSFCQEPKTFIDVINKEKHNLSKSNTSVNKTEEGNVIRPCNVEVITTVSPTSGNVVSTLSQKRKVKIIDRNSQPSNNMKRGHSQDANFVVSPNGTREIFSDTENEEVLIDDGEKGDEMILEETIDTIERCKCDENKEIGTLEHKTKQDGNYIGMLPEVDVQKKMGLFTSSSIASTEANLMKDKTKAYNVTARHEGTHRNPILIDEDKEPGIRMIHLHNKSNVNSRTVKEDSRLNCKVSGSSVAENNLRSNVKHMVMTKTNQGQQPLTGPSQYTLEKPVQVSVASAPMIMTDLTTTGVTQLHNEEQANTMKPSTVPTSSLIKGGKIGPVGRQSGITEGRQLNKQLKPGTTTFDIIGKQPVQNIVIVDKNARSVNKDDSPSNQHNGESSTALIQTVSQVGKELSNDREPRSKLSKTLSHKQTVTQANFGKSKVSQQVTTQRSNKESRSQKTSNEDTRSSKPNSSVQHSQNEAGRKEEIASHSVTMRKVMAEAMRIINDKPAGTQTNMGLQRSQPLNPDIFKSPPIRITDIPATKDISPSAASFTTFRSAFPEYSPEYHQTIVPMNEDVIPSSGSNLFNGLKYPPLKMLIDLDILQPGSKVLSGSGRDKEFRASLTEDGCIESIGGEIFLTPVKWLAAILGKPVSNVKKIKAYNEVNYRGRPLMAYVEDPTVEPLEESHTFTPEVVNREEDQPDSQSSQDSLKRLKNLLNNCTIRLLGEKDLVSNEDLPENFWTEDFSKVKLGPDHWKDIDKWD